MTMKRVLIALLALAALALPAQAAPLSAPCLQTGPTSVQCDPVNSTNPMPTYPAPSSGSTGGVTTAATSVLASNLVVKASAGNLFSFEVSADSTLSAAAWWIMIFDATALPSNGTVTATKCIAMPANATAFSGGFTVPERFATGIVIGVSTTGCFSLTASVHAFIGAGYK